MKTEQELKNYWVGYDRTKQQYVATLCIQDIQRLENAYPFDAPSSVHAIAQYKNFMNSDGMAQAYFESFHP